MTSTEQLEKFRDFVLTEIRDLVDLTDGRVDKFMQSLQNLEDNITGESRRNKSALKKANEDHVDFFEDMISKIQSVKEKLFVEESSRIIYRPYGIEINEHGEIHGAFAFRLFEIFEQGDHPF